jgi:hypothetical protein
VRALSALIVAVTVLMTPVPTLSVTDGYTHVAVRLADGGAYAYSYLNSVYGAPVVELHTREADALGIRSVRSTDIRAVEYFRWDGEPVRDGDAYTQAAPPNTTPRLTIRVTPPYAQRLRGADWAIDLANVFGDSLVDVSPQRMPLGLALVEGWRP